MVDAVRSVEPFMSVNLNMLNALVRVIFSGISLLAVACTVAVATSSVELSVASVPS